MQKKKILFVIHQLNYGGVQKALISALNAIDYTKNEVTLYVRKNRMQLKSDINKEVNKIIVNQDKTHYYRKPYVVCLLIGIKLCGLFKRYKQRNSLQNRINIYINKQQMLYEKKHYFNNFEEYDVAISYIQGYTSQFVAEYVQARRKVMFYHGSTDENHELHNQVMEYFDAIVGVNENVQHVLEGLYPDYEDKMTYIENYVDAEEVRIKSLEYDVPRNKDIFTLCSCGRLAPVKGYDLAVMAANELKSKGIEFIWYFVGDGPERANLKSLIIDYELDKNIIITGMMDNPYPYIGNCDIYVQPSYEEAHPLAIIEATMLNRPIVSTATVGGKALVKDMINGIITEISGKALASGIEKMINNSEMYDRMADFLENIDHSKDFQKYQNAWSQLLGEK